MSSFGGSPPIFAENDKFDGTNWVAWNSLIRIAAEVRGVYGYLDGTIADPSPITPLTSPNAPATTTQTTTTQTTTSAETSWDSPNPSAAEWKVRNAWTKGLLIFNTKNPIGLGINITGNAKDAWTSYLASYQVASDIAVLNAEQDLRNMSYNEADDFSKHIENLRMKWTQANALGADISDRAFKTIVLNTLPRSWDPVVASLYRTQSSFDAISQLNVHWMRISRDRVTTGGSGTTALQATSSAQVARDRRNQLVCTNPRCGRRGHTIDICYWPGGGKEGQFPPDFGKRGGNRGRAPNFQQNFQPQTTANIAAGPSNYTGNNADEVFALMTTATDNLKVPPSNLPHSLLNPDVSAPSSFENSEQKLAGALGATLLVAETMGSVLDTLTIVDSGASDHCFVERASFSLYTEFKPPLAGKSAGKDSTFVIAGKGTVNATTTVEGKLVKLTLLDVLHTPNLRSNLISVSRLVGKGLHVNFNKDKAWVSTETGQTIMTGSKQDNLYVVDGMNPLPSAYLSQSKRKAVTFDLWHRRLGHAGGEAIKEMANSKLVDGMNITGEMSLSGMCEDCIYGKHSAAPYNDPKPHEENLLDRIHIDIWGPSPVQSAGGAKYFMLIIDGASSYRQVYFLNSKSADTTLRVLKEFHLEAERQTGHKLRRIRMDMGREWLNMMWDEYTKGNGIICEYTSPYAHQQNGAAERSMCTILDTARSMLADSGLPTKYWADAVQTAVYVRNFIPSTRTPHTIPLEKWTGQRQDISHLRPFGSTAYAHIPLDLKLSKWSPRSVKVSLIGYYGRDGYKLLNLENGSVVKSRDIIFEEGSTHLTAPPAPRTGLPYMV